MNEPIADAVRSILDGHIVLSRDLAHAGHYPAIDVLQSDLAPDRRGDRRPRCSPTAGRAARDLMAAYSDKEDLIAIGAYQPASTRSSTWRHRQARPRSTRSCASR